MKPSQFEYDPRKAAINLRKHGVSFDEAITVFADPLRSVAVDTQHSWEEERFLVVGQSTRGRVLFIVYPEEDFSVRLIGARVATATERSQYEEIA
jgi:uncharacterized DUF497 family protein